MATATVLPPGQPDIAYAPDLNKYLARTKRRLATEKMQERGLPDGFPNELLGEFVWEGQSVADTYDWAYVLNEVEIAEIESALKHFKGS